MQQDNLWYDDLGTALAHVVQALGGCAAVGKRLWPAKPVKHAETKCANCLNPAHDWKFDLEEIVQILRWGREEGVHVAMYKLCDEAGYGHPQIAPLKSPLEEKAERLQRIAAEFGRLAAEVAAETRQPLKAVS